MSALFLPERREEGSSARHSPAPFSDRSGGIKTPPFSGGNHPNKNEQNKHSPRAPFSGRSGGLKTPPFSGRKEYGTVYEGRDSAAEAGSPQKEEEDFRYLAKHKDLNSLDTNNKNQKIQQNGFNSFDNFDDKMRDEGVVPARAFYSMSPAEGILRLLASCSREGNFFDRQEPSNSDTLSGPQCGQKSRLKLSDIINSSSSSSGSNINYNQTVNDTNIGFEPPLNLNAVDRLGLTALHLASGAYLTANANWPVGSGKLDHGLAMEALSEESRELLRQRRNNRSVKRLWNNTESERENLKSRKRISPAPETLLIPVFLSIKNGICRDPLQKLSIFSSLIKLNKANVSRVKISKVDKSGVTSNGTNTPLEQSNMIPNSVVSSEIEEDHPSSSKDEYTGGPPSSMETVNQDNLGTQNDNVTVSKGSKTTTRTRKIARARRPVINQQNLRNAQDTHGENKMMSPIDEGFDENDSVLENTVGYNRMNDGENTFVEGGHQMAPRKPIISSSIKTPPLRAVKNREFINYFCAF